MSRNIRTPISNRLDRIEEDLRRLKIKQKTVSITDSRNSNEKLTEHTHDQYLTGIDVVGIDALSYRNPVEDKDVTDPSTLSPSEGDRYIVGASAIGDWSGQDDSIAEYNGSTWDFVPPSEGYLVYIKDENTLYVYVSSWVTFKTMPSAYTDLSENASPGTPAVNVGRFYAEDVAGFTTVDWLWSDGVTDYDLDLLRDSISIVRNNSGATLTKGSVVNITGSNGNFPEVELLDATTNNPDDAALGLVFEDIDDNNFGIVLTAGDLENYDTQAFNSGDFLYVDPATPGALTATRPSGRDRVYGVGEVVKSNPAGIIQVNIKTFTDNDFRSLHYSTFLEQIDVAVTSNGTVITATLDNEQGDDYIQAFFADGLTVLTSGAGTLPLTVDTNGTLTAGTDTVPVLNYIYILASAPTTLVASTSGWPTAAHIRCATVNLLSAATTQTDGGAFTNQIWNDEPSFEGANPKGHLAHIGENLRARGAIYSSGIAGAGSTSGYITVTDPGTGDEVYFETGSGKVFQFHEQSWGVFDSATDDIFVKNDNTTPYNRINDLRAGITEDSTGSSIPNNRYFNLVFWGVVNEDSTNNWVGVNLPSGVYQSANAARADRNKEDDYSIPAQFTGVAFLICRITFQKTASSWVVQSTDDLRGNRPSIAQGSFGASQQTEFLDANFRIQDNSDPTKEVAFEASGITTGTTRTLTIPDRDLNLGTPTFDSIISLGNISLGDGDKLYVGDNNDGYLDFSSIDVRLINNDDSGANSDIAIANLNDNANADITLQAYGNISMLDRNDSLAELFVLDFKNRTLAIGASADPIALTLDGNIGFYGTTPVAQSAAYSITNVTTDRDYDASAPPSNQVLADTLGTLIADLQATGIIG